MGIDKEEMQQVMYIVLKELSNFNKQIVFKGSLLLSALMENAEIITPSRLSRDIDGDLQELTTLEEVTLGIDKAIRVAGIDNAIIQVDERTTETQYFFNIYDQEDSLLFGVDIGLKMNPWHELYKLENGAIIYGQTIAKIFWDKICVVSSNDVDRRPWDVFDMYLLSLRNDLYMSEILKVKEGTGRDLEDFKAFLTPSDKLRSVWKRRRYVKDRPEFNDMFARVRDLCTPFITGGASKATWNPKEGLWYEGEHKPGHVKRSIIQ